jgi:hypothetical protein
LVWASSWLPSLCCPHLVLSDVLLAKWDEALQNNIYRIKPQYKATVLEWAKKENLTL